MTAVDWTRLAPHRPLALEQEGRYVARPDGAARLVSLVRAGASPIAVVGPMGSGKSTELMEAILQLASQPDHVVALHMFDHEDDGAALPRSASTSSVLDAMTASLLSFARSRNVEISPKLAQKLVNAGLSSGGAPKPTTAPRIPAADLLRETLREMRGAVGKAPAALFCDGLEKFPADKAHEILDALLPFRGEATLVVVVPTSLVYGPKSYDVLSNFKLFPIRPVPVRDEGDVSGRDGRRFLMNIVVSRLDLFNRPPLLDAVLDRAAEASGGIPRAFLQLVLDAATYARLAQHEWPTVDDLRDAMGDHAESLRRLLVKGDLDELRAADGTEGVEVDPERRVRLLTHGLLLEYKLGDRIVVHPAPLLGITPAQRDAA